MEEERAALKRIVALLFVLAGLAESTCNRSRIVRRFVIWILRRAETVALDFVLGESDASALRSVGPASDSLADAMRLAQSFRDLAYELENQAMFAFAVHDNSGQAGVVRFGTRLARDVDCFLEALRRLVLTPVAQPAAYATGPPRHR